VGSIGTNNVQEHGHVQVQLRPESVEPWHFVWYKLFAVRLLHQIAQATILIFCFVAARLCRSGRLQFFFQNSQPHLFVNFCSILILVSKFNLVTLLEVRFKHRLKSVSVDYSTTKCAHKTLSVTWLKWDDSLCQCPELLLQLGLLTDLLRWR